MRRQEQPPGTGADPGGCGVRAGLKSLGGAMSANRQFAIVTGASSGIGRELAKVCAREGFDLLIAADEPEIETAAEEIRALGATVETVLADLSTIEGVDRLVDAANRLGRPVDALLANAGRGLGRGFLDQDFVQARHVIDTNITGTVYLVHRVGNDMRRRNAGRIMIVGSIAGYVPGSFQAVYSGTKAFLDSFSFALREELRGTKITVTCLMPGATQTKFHERAGMLDTGVGAAKKASAAGVARTGFDAMMRGDGDIVSGFKNRLQAAAAQIIPAGFLARQHRKYAEPGSAQS
jgi:short-subunit dehydrogenase